MLWLWTQPMDAITTEGMHTVCPYLCWVILHVGVAAKYIAHAITIASNGSCSYNGYYSLQDAFLEKHHVKLGFMSGFVKAAAAALQEVPTVNAVIDGNEIVYRDYIDISIAVATPKGLVVPVVRNADKLGFADIEKVGLCKKTPRGWAGIKCSLQPRTLWLFANH